MRYYWFRLKEDFFRDRRLKELRRMENGSALTVLYLELMLNAVNTEGELELMGIGTPAQEVALLLDAEENEAAALLSFLRQRGLLFELENGNLFLPAVAENIGSEGESAERMRRSREAKRTAETESPAQAAAKKEPRIEEKTAHPAPAPAPDLFCAVGCAHNVQPCDTEKEIEKEIETEIENSCSFAPGDAPCGGPPAPPLPLNTGEEFILSDQQLLEYAALYPGVDICAQLRAMRGWLLSNPRHRKTRQGILRFVNGWLAKEQDRYLAASNKKAAAQPKPAAQGYSGKGYSSPPSYDIEAAMRRMMTTVPKVQKKERRSESGSRKEA